MDHPRPAKVALRQKILDDVLAEHLVTPEEFFGLCRKQDLVDARRDAAVRLNLAGFSASRIAKILRRDHTTIFYYLDTRAKGEKRQRTRVYRLLHALPHDVREVIEGVAKSEEVSPYLVIREWIVERAQYEGQAKARAA